MTNAAVYFDGGCSCGAVRYRMTSGPMFVHCCHCRWCQRETGSAFVLNAMIEADRVELVRGEPDIVDTPSSSGYGQKIARCPRCRVALWSNYAGAGSAVRFVRVGTLDEPDHLPPDIHIFTASKQPWVLLPIGVAAVSEYYAASDYWPRESLRRRAAVSAPTDSLERRVDLAPNDRASENSQRNSRVEYSRRLQRVIDHIDNHLDDPLDLGALAEVAHFSPFHFHRVFAAWMGETLGDYVRGRRLDIAATRLAGEPATPVLEVALAIGFQSGEAFARAFKLRFGSTPSAWRTQPPSVRVARIEAARVDAGEYIRNPDQWVRNLKPAPGTGLIQHERSDEFFAEMNMKVKVVDFPATRVAYLRTVGPMGATVGVFWRETVMPWLAANGLSDAPRFGIALDNPAVTTPEKCRYDACVEVPDDFIAKSPAAIRMLPAGRYAVRSFKGNPGTIGDAWMEVFRDWLPSSSMQMDARPCIEYYPANAPVDMYSGAFECELWVPVIPL